MGRGLQVIAGMCQDRREAKRREVGAKSHKTTDRSPDCRLKARLAR